MRIRRSSAEPVGDVWLALDDLHANGLFGPAEVFAGALPEGHRSAPLLRYAKRTRVAQTAARKTLAALQATLGRSPPEGLAARIRAVQVAAGSILAVKARSLEAEALRAAGHRQRSAARHHAISGNGPAAVASHLVQFRP